MKVETESLNRLKRKKTAISILPFFGWLYYTYEHNEAFVESLVLNTMNRLMRT